MRFVRRDDSPGFFELINLDQITRVECHDERSSGGFRVHVFLADDTRKSFHDEQARRLLEHLENRADPPFLLSG